MSNKHNASATLSMETFRDLPAEQSSANTTSREKGKNNDGNGGKSRDVGDRMNGGKASLVSKSEGGITSSENRKTYRSIDNGRKWPNDEEKSHDENFPFHGPGGISLLNKADESVEFSSEANAVNIKYESCKMESEVKRGKILSLILMMIFFEMDLPSDSYHQVLESEVIKKFFDKLAASEIRLLTAAHCDDSVEVSRSWPACTLTDTNFKNLLLMHWKCRGDDWTSSAAQTHLQTMLVNPCQAPRASSR